MAKDNGSMDLTIMRHLYFEPIRENELKFLDPNRSYDIMSTLDRLLKKALVMDINKDSSEPIYKLTRQGQRELERLVAQRAAGPAMMA